IENFDIDVLSTRSPNVTGVLSLHGIEMVSEEQQTWQEQEEILYVHEQPRAGAATANAEGAREAVEARQAPEEEPPAVAESAAATGGSNNFAETASANRDA